jgi:alpha-1,3-rhamnosyl/mannosyltransferase
MSGPGPGATEVLVNLLWLVPGVVGGSEESTTDALRAVGDAAPDGLDLRLAVLAPFLHAHPDLADRFACEVLDADGRDKVRRVLAEQTWLAARTREVGADVVHHAGGVVPLRHPGRVVLTVHDLQPLDMPRNFRPSKRTYIRAMAGRSVRAATVVCVPSEFTRRRVVEVLDAEPERVLVVPWSVRLGPVRAGAPDAGAHDGAGQDGGFPLPPDLAGDPFLLYPAITYPHKNHLVLLDAFAQLARTEPGLRLVLTGGVSTAEGPVRERLARPDLVGRVLRTGRVPAPQLESLFRSATAVVVPSRYEGFGLPVLEAMVRGVPVLAADAGSLPEVARPEDLVPADDVTAWAAAMHAVVHSSGAERSARIRAGRERAATFSPERTARALIQAYRLAAAPDDRHGR